VVGVISGKASKAFDWNNLKEVRIINDKVGNTPIVLVMASDEQSFVAFERPSESEAFTIENDSLFAGTKGYNLSGRNADQSRSLKKLNAYQEFWHSWKTFHPDTEQYTR